MNISDAKKSSSVGPARIAMYSEIGLGKTVLGCHLPNVLYVGAENGIPRDLGFEVDELHPETWLDVFGVVNSLTHDPHNFQSVFFDTADWLEPKIHRFVLDRDSERETEMNPKKNKLLSIEDYGWGKGYIAAEEEFRKLISVLDVMQYRRGIHVMIAMHSIVKTFKNPDGPDFDRHEPKCHSRISNVIAEWAENYLFGKFQIDASKISEDKDRHKRNPENAKAKANPGGGARIIGAQKCASYDAKNRVRLPAEFPLGDPNELISQLLGEHLGRGVTSQWTNPQGRAVPHHVPFTGAGPDAVRAAADSQQDGHRQAQAFYNGNQGRDETPLDHRSNAPLGPIEHAQGIVNGVGRGQDPMPTRGPGNDPPYSGQPPSRPAGTSADPQKTESRNWTPTASQQQLGRPASNRDGDDIARLTEAIMQAGRVSTEYQNKVKAWANKLNVDNPPVEERSKRIDQIIGHVKQTISSSQPQSNT